MNIFESLRVLLGGEPKRTPLEKYTPKAQKIHFIKRGEKLTKEKLAEMEAEHAISRRRHRWRNRRWAVLIATNLLFVVSFGLDIQILEGALTASRFIGFHFADLNSALQVMLAFKEVLVNLLIGTTTVLILWWLLGGRTFCSWVCPYHLIAEFAEKLHSKLVEKKLIKDHTFDRRLRTILYVIFIILAFVTGYTVFEVINPVGILSRALIYGANFALIWVVILLLFEIFYSRRAWCRYVCPIGITYGVIGSVSPLQIKYNLQNCQHEGECLKVCLVPHVLECVKKGRSPSEEMFIGADCTRCGLCVDTCPTDSLTFHVKGLSNLL